MCVEPYLCLPARLYAMERDDLTFTFTHFVHCRPQRIMQFKGVVKIKNIEATDAGVMPVCDDTEVPSDYTERARSVVVTQCQVHSDYIEQARSVAATQCQVHRVLTERARSAATTQCPVPSVSTEWVRSAAATQCLVSSVSAEWAGHSVKYPVF